METHSCPSFCQIINLITIHFDFLMIYTNYVSPSLVLLRVVLDQNVRGG